MSAFCTGFKTERKYGMKKWLHLILAAALCASSAVPVYAEENSNFKTYVEGYEDRTFRPSQTITRAEAVSLIAGLVDDKSTPVSYPDVSSEAWYYNALCKLNANGFLVNFTGNFEPDKNITRLELCEFVYMLKHDEQKDPAEMFAELVSEGIVKGYDDGSYGAETDVSRAEAVTLINRALGVVANADTTSDLYRRTFKDMPLDHWAFYDVLIAANHNKEFISLPEAPPEDYATKVFDKYNEKGNEWQQVGMINDEYRAKGMVQGGEGAQRMNAIAISSDGMFLVEGNDISIIHRSLDGGKTWEKCGRGLASNDNGAMAIDPNNSKKVLCYGNDGLYLSEDQAWSWDLVLPQEMLVGQLHLRETLAYDASSYSEELDGSAVAYWSKNYWWYTAPYYGGYPAQGGVGSLKGKFASEDDIPKFDDPNANVYGVSDPNSKKGLWKTTDGGKTWSVVNEDMTDSIIKVNPENGTVYAANANGFFRSEDGGETFEQILSGAMICGLDVISTYPNRVYINDYKGVLMSEDSGKTFKRISSRSFPDSYDTSNWYTQMANLKVSPLNPNNMVIGYYAGFGKYMCSKWFSTDGGVTWKQSKENDELDFLGNNNREPMFLWSPIEENKVWSFGGDWVVSSTNAGEEYKWDYEGGSAIFVDQRTVFNIYDPDLFYFGSQDFCGALTTDYGKNWKYIYKVSGGRTGGFVYGSYAADTKTLLAWKNPGHGPDGLSDEMRLMVSRDAGENWIDTGILRDENNRKKWSERGYQSPSDRNILFMSQFRSTDYGETWEKMDVDAVYTHNPYGQKELYGGKDQYVMVSYDNGATWEKFCEVMIPEPCKDAPETTEIWDIAYDGINNILYYISGNAGTGHHFCKVQNGVTTELSDNRVKFNVEGSRFNGSGPMQLCTVDPRYPNVIYLGGYKNSQIGQCTVQRSVDGGETFQVISNTNVNHTIVKTGQVGGIEPFDLIVNPETGELWVPQGCAGWTKIAPPYDN